MLAQFEYMVVSCFDIRKEDIDYVLSSFWSERNRQFDCLKKEPDFSRLYPATYLPGTESVMELLLFSPGTSDGVSVMMSNSEDGWASLAYVVTSRIPGACFQFAISHDTSEYARFAFSKIVNGKTVRYVSAMQDPKWVFFEEGMPIDEEDPAQYRKRRVSDRLTAGYLYSLAGKLGFEFLSDEFWASEQQAYHYIEITSKGIGESNR